MLPPEVGRDSLIETKFGTVFKAMFTLFQIMTLDDWGEMSAGGMRSKAAETCTANPV